MRYDLANIEEQIISTLQTNTGLQGVKIRTHAGDINPVYFANSEYREGLINLLPFALIQYQGRTKLLTDSTKKTYVWRLRFRIYTGASSLREKRNAQLSAYQMLSLEYDSLHGKTPKSTDNAGWAIPLLDGVTITSAFTCLSPLEAPEGENERLLINLPNIIVYQSDYILSVLG
jgi:hypothetical protein